MAAIPTRHRPTHMPPVGPHASLPGTSLQAPSHGHWATTGRSIGRHPSLGTASCTSDVKPLELETSLIRPPEALVYVNTMASSRSLPSTCNLNRCLVQVFRRRVREDASSLLSLSGALQLPELDHCCSDFPQQPIASRQQCRESNHLQRKAVHLSTTRWLWFCSLQRSGPLRRHGKMTYPTYPTASKTCPRNSAIVISSRRLADPGIYHSSAVGAAPSPSIKTPGGNSRMVPTPAPSTPFQTEAGILLLYCNLSSAPAEMRF